MPFYVELNKTPKDAEIVAHRVQGVPGVLTEHQSHLLDAIEAGPGAVHPLGRVVLGYLYLDTAEIVGSGNNLLGYSGEFAESNDSVNGVWLSYVPV